jgi:hypothetical protein
MNKSLILVFLLILSQSSSAMLRKFNPLRCRPNIIKNQRSPKTSLTSLRLLQSQKGLLSATHKINPNRRLLRTTLTPSLGLQSQRRLFPTVSKNDEEDKKRMRRLKLKAAGFGVLTVASGSLFFVSIPYSMVLIPSALFSPFICCFTEGLGPFFPICVAGKVGIGALSGLVTVGSGASSIFCKDELEEALDRLSAF